MGKEIKAPGFHMEKPLYDPCHIAGIGRFEIKRSSHVTFILGSIKCLLEHYGPLIDPSEGTAYIHFWDYGPALVTFQNDRTKELVADIGIAIAPADKELRLEGEFPLEQELEQFRRLVYQLGDYLEEDFPDFTREAVKEEKIPVDVAIELLEQYKRYRESMKDYCITERLAKLDGYLETFFPEIYVNRKMDTEVDIALELLDSLRASKEISKDPGGD